MLHVWGEIHGYAGSLNVGTRLNPRRNPRILKDALDGMHASMGRPTTNILLIKDTGDHARALATRAAHDGPLLSRILERGGRVIV